MVKYQLVEDEQVSKPEVKEVPKPIKTIKKAKKDLIQITSDKFRTAISLITDSSTRKSIEDCKILLEHFLLDYEIVEIGRDFYFKKKNT